MPSQGGAASTPALLDVLLVEDDDLIRGCVGEGLRDTGLEVNEHSSATAVLEEIDTLGRPEVLVTDIDLGPGPDGLALASSLQARWPEMAVVYISGRPFRMADRQMGRRERFVAKPFRLESLLEAVEGVRKEAA